MKDYRNMAKQFADEHGFDIVRPCTEHSGYSYFQLDFSNRPRYTGHPHIIKISSTGKILVVADVDEIYWAVNNLQNIEQ